MDTATAKEVKDIKVVDCGSKEARYRIAGIVEGKTENDFNTDDHICDSYSKAISTMWRGTPGRKGNVLCLDRAR
jgi:hypothetical protein